MTTDRPASDLLDAGWRLLARLVATVIALFGSPSELAARGSLTAAVRRRLLIWLRLAEAAARRLLAADPPLPDNAPRQTPRPSGACGGYGRGGFADEDSAAWAVSFRFATPPRARRAVRRARPRPARPRGRSSLALAERLEALVRVCADPHGFARRLRARARRNAPSPAPLSAPGLGGFVAALEACIPPVPARPAAREDSG